MKELFKAINDKLVGDNTIKTLLGYSETNKNIQRGQQLPQTQWEKYLTFREWTGRRFTEATSKLRDVDFMLSSWDRLSDLNCDDIAERVIEVLDGQDLSLSGMHCYLCQFDNFATPVYWDQEQKSYRKDIRFRLIVRKDS